MGSKNQKAPVSDNLRYPYKFPCMTIEGALTRAYCLQWLFTYHAQKFDLLGLGNELYEQLMLPRLKHKV